MIDHNDDWRANLKILADRMREQQKNKKGVTHKGDTIANFRGKIGFNDVGIPLSPKAAKKQQRNRTSYSYPAALRRRNERAKKDAEERWGVKPVPAARSSSSEHHRHRWILPERTHRMQPDSDAPKTKKKHYEYYSGSYEDDAPERVIYVAPDEPKEPVYKAKVIEANGKLKFKNKLEEAIYRHPNYSKQKF